MHEDSLTEKYAFPCEAVPEKALCQAVSRLYEGSSEGIEPLKQGMLHIPMEHIPWFGIENLYILDTENVSCNTALRQAHLSSGAYVNRYGNVLLLIHPDSDRILQYPQLCSHGLRQLYILHSRISSLAGLDNLSQLTVLNLSGCGSLRSLPGLEKLTQLTHLDLSHCRTLADISGLMNLTQLTSLNLSKCVMLSELPRLDKLTHLTSINLSGCICLTKLTGLDELTQLTSLNLRDCESLCELSSLENLTQLISLNLHWCSNLTSLSGLEKLNQLTSLDLRWCRKLISLLGLENMSQLTALNLSNCENLASLSGIENMSQLTALNLSECKSLTVLPDLQNLTQLTNLNLNGCVSLTELQGLKKLSQLTRISLSQCNKLTALNLSGCDSLTSLIISRCDSLTTLDLSRCKRLTELDLTKCDRLTKLDLSGCENLTELDLSDQKKLTELHGLETCNQLTSLCLTNCKKLTRLSGLENLKQLTRLNLSGCCGITSLPESIRQLKSLRRLDLRETHLQDLPDWLPEIAERFNTRWTDATSGTTGAVVDLYRTTVEGVDMSIFEQPHDVILKWFEERKAGRTQLLNEMKVIFLGDGEAGKSYTISRLMNNGGDPLDYEGVRTPGIAIKNHPCIFIDREFKVNYWDFGGQEIMHAMHRVFLTNRTMYVVLVSVEDDDYQERAKYWLRNIKSFAPDAPVLLAFNKIDMRPRLFLDEKALRAANGNLKQIVSMSALEFDQAKFDSEFRSVLLQEIVNTGMLDVQWPKSWIELKSRMENLDKYYIPLDDYEEICTDCHVEDVGEELLKWFNDLGVSFYFPDNLSLENQVILNPRWITNGLYIILFNQCEGIANGIVPRSSIHDLLKRAPKDPAIQCTDRKAKYTRPGDVEYVLGIMRQFGLSLQIGEDREFIPMLCQPHPTLDLAAYETDEKVLEFHMAFEYLPNNVLHQLMVKQYSELDPENVWRSGARFQQPGTGLRAVVAMDGNTLKFFISHSDSHHAPQTYLTALKGHVDQIWQNMGLQQPEDALIYKLAGKRDVFDYEELNDALENGNGELYSKTLKRRISAADLLSRFGLAESEQPPHQLGRSIRKESVPPTELQLLENIGEACRHIQADPIYSATGDRSGKENQRNRRIRDDLKLLLKGTGYHVSDQSERGFSKSGQGSGELDILLEDDNGVLWTVIEALRIHSSETSDWSEHLSRLLDNYNYAGLRFAYLVTYVDTNEKDFLKIWKDYQEYIPAYDPGRYIADKNSFKELNTDQDLQYIQKAVCCYTCVSAKVTVYHLFVMVKPQQQKPHSKSKSSNK